MNNFQYRITALRNQLLEVQNNLLLVPNGLQNPNTPRAHLLQKIDYMLKKVDRVLDREKKEAEQSKAPKLNPGVQSDAEAISKAQQAEDEKRRRAEERRRQQEEEEEAQELERVINELKKQEQTVQDIENAQTKIIEINETIIALERPLNETKENIVATEKALQKVELLIDEHQSEVTAQKMKPTFATIDSGEDYYLKELQEKSAAYVKTLHQLKEFVHTTEAEISHLQTQSAGLEVRINDYMKEYTKSEKALSDVSSKVVERAAAAAGIILTPRFTRSKTEEELDDLRRRSSAPTLTPIGFGKG